MIRIEIDLAVTLYLSFSILILLIWIAFEWGKKISADLKENKALWQCPTCFYTYIDSRSKEISKCPRCKTLHKKGKKE
jgi:hypothetical protein